MIKEQSNNISVGPFDFKNKPVDTHRQFYEYPSHNLIGQPKVRFRMFCLIQQMITLQSEDVTSFKSLAKTVQNILMSMCPLLAKGLYLLLFTLVFGLGYYGTLTIFTIRQSLGFTYYVHLLLIVWNIFNIVFNYVMSITTKPGTPSNIPSVILAEITHKCSRCSKIKPPRTHHCSICNQCVLQMDHHCPWIGACVGHHNRRYFMNFLTYVIFGLTQLLILSRIKQFDIIVLTLVISLLVCLGCFTGFHWYLTLKGLTSLQICWDDPRYTPQPSIRTNLKIVFGTSNIFLCLMPSIQVLDNWGDQWQTI